MRRAPRGYTIVETMIVLAVSGVILSAAVLMFRGQQGKTQFTQSMRDIDSKIQTIAKDIASGVSSTPEQRCSIGSNDRPSLLTGESGGVGTNEECIFLGKAIQATPGRNNIRIYTVLGKRAASSFSDAKPTSVGSSDNYSLMGGSTILSSRIYDFSSATPRNSGLVGIYLGMNNNASDSGSAGGPIFIRGYNTSGNNPAPCIEESSSCTNMPQVSKWRICFRSAYDSNSTATLDVSPSSSGVTTQLSFDGCS